MKKPEPGTKNYHKRYLKWWKQQDRKIRGEMTLWDLLKGIFKR